jgi:hypothetical protein
MRKIKSILFLSLAVCLILQGCSSYVWGPQAIPDSKAVIYVYSASVAYVTIKCDNKKIGKLQENYRISNYLAIAVDPGPHRISCWRAKAPAIIDAEAGNTYYVELYRESQLSKWKLRLKDDITGEYSITKRRGRPLVNIEKES